MGKNINILDNELEKYSDILKEAVIKDEQLKRTVKIFSITRRVNPIFFKKICFLFKEKGFYFSRRFNGFVFEELEHKPEDKISTNDKKLSIKEMQEQFFKNNKVKKLEDGGCQLTDIERKSISHRSGYFVESEYEALYDGLVMYDKNNKRVVITFHSRSYGVASRTIDNAKITYYNISRLHSYTNGITSKIKYKQCTIKQWIDEGVLTKEPKLEKENKTDVTS